MIARQGKSGDERRKATRYPTRNFQVDLQSGETFLFSYVENISEIGIFVATETPLPIGASVKLRFPDPCGRPELKLTGRVRWINPVRPGARNPGMGIAFEGLTAAQRRRVVEIVRAVAYLTKEG